MNINALKHFERKAKEYSDFRKKGVLGVLVGKEVRGIIKSLPNLRNKSVLELGCGTGMYTRILKSMGADVFALDFSFEMAREAKKAEEKILVASINNFKLRRKFDVILCTGAMEFIRNQEEALKNISEHLNRRGVFITLYPRTSIGGMLYKLYHKLINGVDITILPIKEFEKLLNLYFLNEQSKLENKIVNFINYILKVQKNG